MYFKICALAALVGCALAAPHATSYASVTQHHDHYGDYHHDYLPQYGSAYAGYGYGYGNGYGLGLGDDYNGYYGGYNGGYYDHHDDHYDGYHYPQYAYKYGVEDPHTHDIKSQEEHRDGDVVKGHYKLVQPDGRTRIVHYTADKHNGFNADVQYLGHAAHPSYYKYY
ncbi:adult-specific cuticular protein ACP-20-like [Atheta coriaria]|uniref:adult-specific cuticular protein ACP-20-like n=1 Tax=Dalotia coriaria TaxID=877792 RepID=UPI0031F400D9